MAPAGRLFSHRAEISGICRMREMVAKRVKKLCVFNIWRDIKSLKLRISQMRQMQYKRIHLICKGKVLF